MDAVASAVAASKPRPPALAGLPASPEEAQKTAKDFEAFFVNHMLESVFASSGPDKMFGGGQGEMVYRSLLLQEYGKVAAERGGFGVAEAVQREMLRMQEVK